MSEAQIKRNPHPDFKKVEASRPPFDTSSTFRYTQTVNPSWTFGSGANSLASKDSPSHVSIDPDDPARPSVFNYKMLISAITPRPIAFISSYWPTGVITENGNKNVEQNGNKDVEQNGNKDVERLANLAPFSYFNMVAHDPPTFVVGFASPLVEGKMKDTLANLNKTGECVLNIISEHFIEAANSTSINAPPEASEWDVSGLTQVFDCVTVPKCARVKEAIFSVECKVESIKEIVSRREPGKKTGAMVILEGTRFWVREDAVNDDLNMVDPKVLRPISRLGGITYARTTEVFEIPRPDFVKDYKGNL